MFQLRKNISNFDSQPQQHQTKSRPRLLFGIVQFVLLFKCFTSVLAQDNSYLDSLNSDKQLALKSTHHDDSLRLHLHHHHQYHSLNHRWKRQAGSPQSSSSGGSGSASGTNSGSSTSSVSDVSSGSGGSDQSDPNSSDDKPKEEVLNNLKCDFGSADALDLCKFEILDNDVNPLGKGLATWSLGSGKLALFQGGPLIDASQGNDTNGGYIFYETSNPYASTPASQVNSSFSPSPPASHHQHTANDYTTVLSSSSAAKHMDPFQQVSSARVMVGSHLPGPTFISPNLTAPGPAGMCLSFHYAIQGLSAEELRIYVTDHKTGRSRQIWASTESAASNWTKGEVLYSVTNKHSLMFSATNGPSAVIKDLQQRKFRGHLALDEIQIDKHDPLAGDGACRGHCNFDGDLCGWTNAENGQEDNFDWSFGRGSDNLFTGPARDFTSSTNNEITGSYLFTDSGYPRRPGDRAVLMSPIFQPTAVNDAMCMRLAVHMFGSGVGSLVIKIRYADESASSPGPASSPSGQATAPGGGQSQGGSQSGAGDPNSPFASASSRSGGGSSDKPNDLVIWEMSGDAGNSWHQAQTSVSSSKSPFQVLIEGVIGENHLGNIAIDEISFSSGPCPTSPPVASKNYGDCTFEQSMCYWRNPDADIHLDDLDWIRTADEQSIHGPNFDHTLKKRSGSYLKLENTFREPKSGSRAFLLSPVFQPKASGSVQCLSFYYYMFMRSISSSGPNLGTIRVYLASNNELVPIWRMTNPISSPNWKHARASLSSAIVDGEPQAPTKLFQIAFEGIWGDAATGAIALDDITVFDGACDIMPAEAKSVPGECTFDVDMCSWTNKTSESVSAPSLTLLDGQIVDPADTSRSPFLQSVNSAAAAGTGGGGGGGASLASGGGGTGGPGHYGLHSTARLTSGGAASRRPMSWQLATVDSRPVNLQDHTYKAPIGYAYVDVLDGGSQQMAFQLQGAEVTVQPGQQVALCLSFWFAAYGRQDANQLSVYLTQASAPPQPADESGSSSAGSPSPQAGRGQVGGGGAGSSSPGGSQFGSSSGGSAGGAGGQAGNNLLSSAASGGAGGGGSGGSSDGISENANAWKSIYGKLLWSMSLKNITESNRRKWLYGQVSLRADSNYIVRFVAISNDGGFALDDVSYFDGGCEARPALARVQSAEDEAAELQAGQQPPAPVATKPA